MGAGGSTFPAFSSLSRARCRVEVEAREARPLSGALCPHSPPYPVPLWPCQGPRPASARSQPTRLWWLDSGPCSPACCSTTRGSCNGPRMGWRWAWARASKVSGPCSQPSVQTTPSFHPSPTNRDSWTQHPFVPHHVSSLCSSLPSPISV